MSFPVLPVRRVFRIANGGTPTSDQDNWGGEVAWATPVDLAKCNGNTISATQRSITLAGLHSGSRAVPEDSLIVSSRAPIGYVAQTTRSMAFNQGCKGMVPTGKTDIRYFRYQLSTMTEQLKSFGQGSTFLELSADDLATIPIIVPPPSAQRQIADYLDIETARIDTLISNKRRLIELLDERRAAYVGTVVVAGLGNRDDLVETGSHHVPRVPSGWRLMRLRHVVEQIIDTPHKTAPVVDDKEYLVVRTSNVKMGRLVFDDARYTDRESWIEWNRRGEPRPGDVMFTREAPAGEACVVPVGVPLCIGQRMVLLRVNPAVACGEWIVHSIYSGPAQRFIEELSNATTVAHLNMSDIHDIPIVVPNLDEQQQILAQVRVEVRRHEQTVSMLDKQITLLAERRRALITAAVTGGMAVPSPAIGI